MLPLAVAAERPFAGSDGSESDNGACKSSIVEGAGQVQGLRGDGPAVARQLPEIPGGDPRATLTRSACGRGAEATFFLFDN